ncbi:hypothetical protein PISMIDRAFT_379540 [Pisolithus microcarpus 441]|uniref:Uncharacterized protein n=1 Tax=Pisolithus microcarpus 441 TaxID=765257 RepID=A0A0C9YTS6_9AGAM|nr:hypothetical protein PISMIDRAFT_379540 [Pisolithus microcarpus 441]
MTLLAVPLYVGYKMLMVQDEAARVPEKIGIPISSQNLYAGIILQWVPSPSSKQVQNQATHCPSPEPEIPNPGNNMNCWRKDTPWVGSTVIMIQWITETRIGQKGAGHRLTKNTQG